MALGAVAGEQGAALLCLVLDCIGAGGRRVRVPMAAEDEVGPSLLAAAAFVRARGYVSYAARGR